MPSWKLFSPDSSKGFSLVELLVAMTIGSVMCAMAVGGILANRKLYQHDLARTRLTQNLRSSMEYLGVNIREAGENLPLSVPAVELINGINGASDELIVRRSMIDEVLKLCQPIAAGSGVSRVYFAHIGEEAGCTFDTNLQNYSAWRDYRIEQGGTVSVYIYDPYSQLGEFFKITGEDQQISSLALIRNGGAFVNSYSVGQSALFLMEEWHFRVGDDWEGDPVFQIIENDDVANPKNVTHGLTSFQVRIFKTDGTVVEEFSRTDQWVDIASIEVTISGREIVSDAQHTEIASTYSARFFPRNILSH
ncbi:MAG: prepilin-type N-terminal cleavage/methylation domain-containing protein [Deltaproteobacteria bacterium]|nr:prepilin-type N-terminal cleavage/methylation domain-containing protein [Deltaproteobacteria bacterium]